ncbi:MAG: hypothetical protein ACPGUD_10515 [Parashewanella sp.]
MTAALTETISQTSIQDQATQTEDSFPFLKAEPLKKVEVTFPNGFSKEYQFSDIDDTSMQVACCLALIDFDVFFQAKTSQTVNLKVKTSTEQTASYAVTYSLQSISQDVQVAVITFLGLNQSQNQLKRINATISSSDNGRHVVAMEKKFLTDLEDCSLCPKLIATYTEQKTTNERILQSALLVRSLNNDLIYVLEKCNDTTTAIAQQFSSFSIKPLQVLELILLFAEGFSMLLQKNYNLAGIRITHLGIELETMTAYLTNWPSLPSLSFQNGQPAKSSVKTTQSISQLSEDNVRLIIGQLIILLSGKFNTKYTNVTKEIDKRVRQPTTDFAEIKLLNPHQLRKAAVSYLDKNIKDWQVTTRVSTEAKEATVAVSKLSSSICLTDSLIILVTRIFDPKTENRPSIASIIKQLCTTKSFYCETSTSTDAGSAKPSP